MITLSELKDRLADAARGQAARYAGDEERPLRGYATTMGIYTATAAGLAGVVRVSGKDVPNGLQASDLLLCTLATHKLSRLIAKDPVTSPLRAPFTSYRGTQGPSELAEDVRGEGGRKTVGELVTCPFCTGMWVATGLTAGVILLPRTTRIAMGTLTALAGADILQFIHAWLDKVSQ